MLLKIPSSNSIPWELVKDIHSLGPTQDLPNLELWGQGPRTVSNALQVILTHTETWEWVI